MVCSMCAGCFVHIIKIVLSPADARKCKSMYTLRDITLNCSYTHCYSVYVHDLGGSYMKLVCSLLVLCHLYGCIHQFLHLFS